MARHRHVKGNALMSVDKVITVASRTPRFAWAGRLWNTEPTLVRVADQPRDDDDDAEFRITHAQYAELRRQCQYPHYPLRIGTADATAHQVADARRELDDLLGEVADARKALDELRSERDKADKQLKSQRKRLKDTKRQLEEAENARQAAEARADKAEAQLSIDSQVEARPDPNRERN
jgi:chromosome segregation ATPase